MGSARIPRPVSSSATVLDMRNEVAGRLQARFAVWSSEPLRRHALAVALLMLTAALRWWPQVFDPLPQNDEMVYFRAFEAVARGGSPFVVSGYMAFSFLARVGAWGLELLGMPATLALLRVTNLAGLAVCVWCSSAWIPWSWRRRLLAGMLFVALAPAVRFGVVLGNLSLLMAGMLVAALLFWPRAPLVSGALLGLSVAVKPVAPGAIVALLFHRPDGGGRRHLLAAGVGAAVTAAIVLGSLPLETLVTKDIWFRLARTVSPYRFAHLLDLRGSVPVVMVLVVLLTVLVARSRRLGPTQCFALAVTAAIAATPVVWSHTLLVTLPLQVLALLVLYYRWEASRQPESRLAPHRLALPVEAALVILAVVAIQAAEGATNIYDQHLWIQWLGTIPPAVAPAALSGYLIRQTTAF